MTWAVGIATAAAAPACSFERVPGAPAPDAPLDAPMDTVVIGDASDDWWDPLWERRRQITIKNGELSGPVQDFPLLVRLPANVGRGNGEDLRFVAADQQIVLPHELDKADAGGKLVWVRIPEILKTGPEPVLWVYYGNAAAQSTSSGAQVFADRHVSVHHLGQSLADATGHGHDASSMPTQTPMTQAGRIGDARRFDGQNDYLELAGEAAYDFTTSLTVSAWVRVANLGPEYQAIVTKGDKTWRLHRAEQTAFVGFGTTLNNNNDNQSGAVDIANGNDWHHVAIVLGNATKQIYVDGELDQSKAVAPTIDTSDYVVMFGRNREANVVPDRYWNGHIDEVRITGAARDAHWLFAEHHTVDDEDFVTVGVEEIVPR